MDAVFRFVEHCGLRALEHLLADLLSDMGGQAVEEQRIGFGKPQQRRGHLIRGKRAQLGGLISLSHRYPAVGDQHIGTTRRRRDVKATPSGRSST